MDCSPGIQPMVVMGRSIDVSLGTSAYGILREVAGEGDYIVTNGLQKISFDNCTLFFPPK